MQWWLQGTAEPAQLCAQCKQHIRDLSSMSAALPAHPLQVTAYAIDSVQQRGRLFAAPGDQVYEGQVIGIYQRQGDLKVWGAGRAERGVWVVGVVGCQWWDAGCRGCRSVSTSHHPTRPQPCTCRSTPARRRR